MCFTYKVKWFCYRSQHQNKASAMAVLQSRLDQLEMQRQAQINAEHTVSLTDINFGSQIRSYVLHVSTSKPCTVIVAQHFIWMARLNCHADCFFILNPSLFNLGSPIEWWRIIGQTMRCQMQILSYKVILMALSSASYLPPWTKIETTTLEWCPLTTWTTFYINSLLIHNKNHNHVELVGLLLFLQVRNDHGLHDMLQFLVWRLQHRTITFLQTDVNVHYTGIRCSIHSHSNMW